MRTVGWSHSSMVGVRELGYINVRLHPDHASVLLHDT